MAYILPPQHRCIRLRRRPGDPLLYITSSGITHSGYLAEAHLESRPYEGLLLVFETEEHPYDICGEGIDASRHEIPVDRLLRADVDQLHKTVPDTDHRSLQLLTLLEEARPGLCDDEPPACGHEDVVEVTELGSTVPTGICYWCPAPLVKLNDQWVRA